MSDTHDRVPDADREVFLDDEAEFELPPATLDDREAVEVDAGVDPRHREERDAAIESGDLAP